MLINRLVKRQSYSIPDSLTHSSGTITAIFGSAVYNVALSGLASNTLYFLYISGSTLSYSVSLPSAMKLSNPEAMLIGAFYSNGMTSVAFGSFVNIEGSPRTNNINWSDQLAPLGAVSYDLNNARWYRDGDVIRGKFRIRTVTSPAVDARLTIPTNISMDSTNLTGGSQNLLGMIEKLPNAAAATTSENVALSFIATYPNQMYVTKIRGGGQVTQVGWDSTGVANDVYVGHFEFPVTGWSSTPLKDL